MFFAIRGEAVALRDRFFAGSMRSLFFEMSDQAPGPHDYFDLSLTMKKKSFRSSNRMDCC